jgi:hypothetical protein
MSRATEPRFSATARTRPLSNADLRNYKRKASAVRREAEESPRVHTTPTGVREDAILSPER